MRRALWVIPFLAGCSPMTADYKPNNTQWLQSLLHHRFIWQRAEIREVTIEFMDIDARNMCNSGYTLIGEKRTPS